MAALSTPTIHSSIALTCAGYVTMIGGEGNFPGPGGAACERPLPGPPGHSRGSGACWR